MTVSRTPAAFRAPDSGLGGGLHHVGDDNVAHVAAVHRDMDNGAHAVAGDEGDSQPVHELVVAGGHGTAVHGGGDALPADLLNVGHPGAVQLLAAGPLEAFADGVGGGGLGQSGVLQQPLVFHLAVVGWR